MLMFLGKIVTLKDLKVQVNRKQISPQKCLKIQTKDNQDMLWWIYKYSFLEETFAIEPKT